MNRIMPPAALVLSLLWPQLLFPLVAAAQEPPDLPTNPKITTEYMPPTLQVDSDRLKARRVLEELSQFLSPLKLQTQLTLRTRQCDTLNAFYSSTDNSINVCLEYPHFFNDELAAFVEGKLYYDKAKRRWTKTAGDKTVLLKPRIPMTRTEAAVGDFLGTFFHELGHAVFDILEVPVLGREEDAADEFATLIMVQFGPEVARTAIKGTLSEWDLQAQIDAMGGRYPYYDEHSTNLQRLGTYLCIAYGSPERAAFQDIMDLGVIPRARLETCESQYRQAADAFVATIMPSIDKDLMEKVKAHKWLRPEEMR
jgi:hypothetical protein